MIKKLNEHVVFRYIISGGTSATVDLVALYILNTLLRVHYLLAATIAFGVAFFVSFTMHKFWTFRDRSTKSTHIQVAIYLITSLFGLSLNTLFMYIFVDRMHVMVLMSQVFAGAIVACGTFFLSRKFVFKNSENIVSVESASNEINTSI